MSRSGTRFGRRIAAGGEGTVYAMNDATVAKIYASAPDTRKTEKLRALLALGAPSLRNIAAMPERILYDEAGQTIGFEMRQVRDAVPISEVASPLGRKRTMPNTSWRWLVRTARNLAAAMDEAHRHGIVLGDVNESNFLVADDATVTIIDVDSYQVEWRGDTLTCDVGIPMFQPPEQQNRAFPGLPRTTEHDAFGLAVLIFELLFMGRHPWSGDVAGPEVSLTDGTRIARLPFAWSADGPRAGITTPQGAVPMSAVGPDLAEMFERAFAQPKTRRRPTPAAWTNALERFETELRTCAENPRHHHREGPCVWCALRATQRIDFFAAPDAPKDDETWVNCDELERINRTLMIKSLSETYPTNQPPQPYEASTKPQPLSVHEAGRLRRFWATVAASTAAGVGALVVPDASFHQTAAFLDATAAAAVLAVYAAMASGINDTNLGMIQPWSIVRETRGQRIQTCIEIEAERSILAKAWEHERAGRAVADAYYRCTQAIAQYRRTQEAIKREGRVIDPTENYVESLVEELARMFGVNVAPRIKNEPIKRLSASQMLRKTAAQRDVVQARQGLLDEAARREEAMRTLAVRLAAMEMAVVQARRNVRAASVWRPWT